MKMKSEKERGKKRNSKIKQKGIILSKIVHVRHVASQ